MNMLSKSVHTTQKYRVERESLPSCPRRPAPAPGANLHFLCIYRDVSLYEYAHFKK